MDISNIINRPELEKVIDESKIESYYQFEYQNRVFTIFIHNHTKEDESKKNFPFFWQGNSSIGDYDVYIATNIINKVFAKPILLHETLEAFLQEALPYNVENGSSIKTAHNIAKEYDEKYAKKMMDDSLFLEYLQFKKNLIKSF